MTGFFDPLYWLLILPGMILASWASWFTQATFNKYSQYSVTSGFTGAQAATHLLHSQGIHNVSVERVNGFLSDHYDPITRTLRLSPKVYNSRSLSAIGVACHEAGHALQHANNYAPLTMRSMLVPVTQIGTNAAYFFFFIGIVLGFVPLMKLGAILFSVFVLFTLITLPVEWDASARAKRLMVSAGIVSYDEQKKAAKVLNAAFMTYVASLLTALLTLIYYLIRSGLLRRD
jgi:hypothetical protein